MEQKLVKIDLHIHTPMSKCYKGAKSEDEYINILKKIYDCNIRLIAITDHNTIDGYKKLMEIRDNASNTYKVIEKYQSGTNTQIDSDIQNYEQILKYFEEITILPGVEITLNPKVHMIVISSHEEINDLSDLLSDIGYTPDKRGTDNESSIDTDVKIFLNNSYLNNKIVIAPHIDSNCGIFKEIVQSTYRADIMKSPIIKAMTCNNVEQLKKIKHLLQYEPAYKRETPIAFLNCSDAHCIDDIGTKVSYAKINHNTMGNLKYAIDNPEECISDVNDSELKSYVNKLIQEGAYLISELQYDDELYLTKCICACLNSERGKIVLGVTSDDKELLGIKSNRENIEKHLIITKDKLSNDFKFTLHEEALGNGRYIFIVHLHAPRFLFWYLHDSQESYFIQDKIQKTKLSDIEKIVKRNTLKEFKDLEENNSIIIKNLSYLNNISGKLSLIHKINNRSVYLEECVDLEIMHPMDVQYDEINDIYLNNIGCEIGNEYFVFSNDVRLENGILRYSCPVTNIKLPTTDKIFNKTGNQIVVSSKGGTYLINNNEWSIFSKDYSYLLLQLKDNFSKDFSIYSLIGWLKSSVAIWYALRKCISENLYLPFVFKKMFVPKLESLKPGKAIERLVIEIIECEKEFIRDYNNILLSGTTDDEKDKFIDSHNEIVELIAKQIDEEIISELDITREELEWIVGEIEAEDIYNIIEI